VRPLRRWACGRVLTCMHAVAVCGLERRLPAWVRWHCCLPLVRLLARLACRVGPKEEG
jgi:hypothetical protein